jgi:hypothetical protein
MRLLALRAFVPILATGLIAWACGGSLPQIPTPLPTPTPAGTPKPPAIFAAGDISCDTATPGLACQSKATSDLILKEREGRTGSVVLPLGDLQYDNGTFNEFNVNYDKTWGRLNEFAHPTVGNHEYDTARAAGYFSYFQLKGVAVGSANELWYDFDFAGWHFVSLNSNCERIGTCNAGSVQYRWLEANLSQNRATRCTVAYMHHPFRSSGLNGDTQALQPLMQLLYTNNVDIVLAGHDHDFEVFDPITPQGVSDPEKGFRMFVVGTGGRDLQGWTRAAASPTAFRFNEAFGVLKIELKETQYQWALVATKGTIVKTGNGTCF